MYSLAAVLHVAEANPLELRYLHFFYSRLFPAIAKLTLMLGLTC